MENLDLIGFDTREKRILEEETLKAEEILRYMNKNGEATSQELQELAGSSDSYERGDYVRAARALDELDILDSEFEGEMKWYGGENFEYEKIKDNLDEIIESPEDYLSDI